MLSIPIAASARLTQSDLVLVRAGDVVTEDLYAAANRIAIEGRIEGDLMAVAYEDVVISGEVTGDVLIVASTVTISGTVGGSVRVAAALVEVSGLIGDDMVAASWNLTVMPSGVIGRDLINWGRTGKVEGLVERNLTGRFSRLSLDGEVGGSVDVNIGTLAIGTAAEIDGDVFYRSANEAVVDSSAINGSVIQRTPMPANIKVRALQLLGVVLVVLVLSAAGLLLASTRAEKLESMMRAARRGWRTWLEGLGILILPLIGAGILGFVLGVAPAAGVPLLIILLPVTLGLGGLVLLAALIGVIPAAAALGKVVARRQASPAVSLLVGMLFVGVVVFIPGLRWVAAGLIVPLGLGSLQGSRSSDDRQVRSVSADAIAFDD